MYERQYFHMNNPKTQQHLMLWNLSTKNLYGFEITDRPRWQKFPDGEEGNWCSVHNGTITGKLEATIEMFEDMGFVKKNEAN